MTDAQTMPVKVGVVAESGTGERRVALVPKAVASLVNSGVAVVVESGAGERALLPDELYTCLLYTSSQATCGATALICETRRWAALLPC